MTLLTRQLRIHLLSHLGLALPGAQVTAQLSIYEIDGTDVVPLLWEFDEDPGVPGDYIGPIWSNARSNMGSQYTVIVQNLGELLQTTTITIDDAEGEVVHQVRVNAPPYPKVYEASKEVAAARIFSDAAGDSASLAMGAQAGVSADAQAASDAALSAKSSEENSAGYAAQGSLSAEAAAAAAEEARAAANATGVIAIYTTFAEASVAASTIADSSYVEVITDETRDDARTRYQVVSGALVYRVNMDQWRITLAASDGASKSGYGSATVFRVLDGARPLSYFGVNRAGLLNLADYVKSTDLPVRLDSHLLIEEPTEIDLAGHRLVLDFAGYRINSDLLDCLRLLNPDSGSQILQPDLRNITAPWAITRWSADGSWLADGAATLATLTQTNADGYYQPSSNDTDIWSSLTSAQQVQLISPRLYVYGAEGLLVHAPRGRHCLYEFDMCQNTLVQSPDIRLGGKGQYGTILFRNLETTGYGHNNRVVGGQVRYGSFSSVCFMRQGSGGVYGGFYSHRAGESGVKTFQNQVGGRSARCYNMMFDSVRARQPVYDGLDLCSDYGASVDRVDDYTLAQYAWHSLPTGHSVNRPLVEGARGAGIWGDGALNTYKQPKAVDCRKSGMHLIVPYSEIDGAVAISCNRDNVANGTHQLLIDGASARVINPFVYTDSTVTAGAALYTVQETTITVGGSFSGSRTTARVFRESADVNGLTLGTTSLTQSEVSVLFHPRGSYLANPCAAFGATLSYGISGAEVGQAYMRGVQDGAQVKGFRARGSLGGYGVIAVGSGTPETAVLASGEMAFGEDSSGNLIGKFKNSAGTVVSGKVTFST